MKARKLKYSILVITPLILIGLTSLVGIILNVPKKVDCQLFHHIESCYGQKIQIHGTVEQMSVFDICKYAPILDIALSYTLYSDEFNARFTLMQISTQDQSRFIDKEVVVNGVVLDDSGSCYSTSYKQDPSGKCTGTYFINVEQIQEM